MTRRWAIATALVLATACGSDSTGPDDGNGGGGNPSLPGTMTAVVDGQNWSASAGLAAAHNSQYFTISGVAPNGTAIAFSIGPLTGAGTYTTGPGRPTNLVMTSGTSGWVASVVGGSGTFTITTLTDTDVRGTFSASVVASASGVTPPTRTIAQGAFNVRVVRSN